MANVDAQSQPGTSIDPLRAFRFVVEVHGVGQGHFTSVHGMGVEIEAIKYREGGNEVNPRFIPGQVDYSEITLKFGLTEGDQMWDWLMSAARGEVDRREVSIVMRDSTGANEVLRWNCTRAWAKGWRGSELNASGRELAIESMTLVHEGITRDATSAPADDSPPGAPGT